MIVVFVPSRCRIAGMENAIPTRRVSLVRLIVVFVLLRVGMVFAMGMRRVLARIVRDPAVVPAQIQMEEIILMLRVQLHLEFRA